MAGISHSPQFPASLRRPPEFVDALHYLREARAAAGIQDSPETDIAFGRIEALLDGLMIPQVQFQTLHALWITLAGCEYLIANASANPKHLAEMLVQLSSQLKLAEKFFFQRAAAGGRLAAFGPQKGTT